MDLTKIKGARLPIVLTATIVMIAATLAQPYRLVVVQGNSMSPTYSDSSVLVVSRSRAPLHRGDVVVLDTPEGTLIKRVAFLPGDIIQQVKMGSRWEDATAATVSLRSGQYMHAREYRVPPNKVYVLGDNRSGSIDSGTFGPVSVEDVWGIVLDQRSKFVDPDIEMFALGINKHHEVLTQHENEIRG